MPTNNTNELDELLKAAGLSTQAIRGGQHRSLEQEHSEPIFTTSSYVFNSASEAAETFSGSRQGNVYSRYTNPTVRTFEQRLALMEGAEQAVATSSGMSAILATCMALLKSGDRIVCSGSIFGSTVSLFNKYMGKFGVEVVYVSATDVNAWQQAMTKNTRLLFVETPSNPMSDIVDIEALADIAHQNNALLAVDNCFCTCALQKPMELGADIVVYSATKYIDGQGRCMGGAVVGNKKEMDDVLLFLRTAGPTMSPFNAWVFLKGLETLSLRMNAHSSNAMALALWLDEHPAVEKVFYAGLPSSAGHALAKKQQSGFGGVLAFTVKGGQPQAWTVIDNTQLLSLTANLGDVKSTIVHPATTTHGRLTEEERQTMGITDNLIRIAVGLEDIEDIKADLNKGLMLI